MELWEKIVEVYPELKDSTLLQNGIFLQDDSDGSGAFIREWNYSKPIPQGFKVGK